MAVEIVAAPGEANLRVRQGQTMTYRQTWVTNRSSRHVGNWTAGAQYLADDVVTYNGIDWIALRDNAGVTPAVGADWDFNEDVLNLTGYEIQIAMKATDDQGLPVGNVLLSFSTEEPSNGGSTVSIVDAPNGIVDFKITDEDSASLPDSWRVIEASDGSLIDKRGIWAEELHTLAGDVPLVIQGRVYVHPQVS